MASEPRLTSPTRRLAVASSGLRGELVSTTDSCSPRCRSHRASGLEADAVLELAGGGWAAFEVKLGVNQVEAAAQQLLKLRDRVDSAVAGPPAALAVITATGYSYMRPDGVAVIAISALGL